MIHRFGNLLQFFVIKPQAIFSVPGIRRIKGYTMQTLAGVYQMREHIQDVKNRDIEGAIVETGCWKGGLGAYMAQFERPTWLFDSFEGLPEMTERDKDITSPKGLALYKKTGYIAVPEEMARHIAEKLKTKPNIIKGWFNDTLPRYKKEIGPIAILRLDGDTYASTKQALDVLYESVSRGGIIVVDDYHDFGGCREALYNFFQEHKITAAIHRYPFGRAYFVKE